MKAILNWRYYVIALLLIAGILATARIFGDTVRPMTHGEWFLQAMLSAATAASSFYALALCVSRWERRGLIPEFTNLTKE